MSDSELISALRQFVVNLVATDDPEASLDELTERATDLLDITGAGVVLADDEGRLRLVAASSEAIQRVETAEQLQGQGPCLEVFTTGRAVVVPDLAADDRWPRYRDVTLDNGLRAVAGVPLIAVDQPVGSLNAYNAAPRTFTESELETLDLLGTLAAACVTTIRDLKRTRRLAVDLQQALDRRVPIEQAKGMIATKLDVSLREAFQLLRARARAEQRTVRDLATELTTEGLNDRWDPPSGGNPASGRPGRMRAHPDSRCC